MQDTIATIRMSTCYPMHYTELQSTEVQPGMNHESYWNCNGLHHACTLHLVLVLWHIYGGNVNQNPSTKVEVEFWNFAYSRTLSRSPHDFVVKHVITLSLNIILKLKIHDMKSC